MFGGSVIYIYLLYYLSIRLFKNRPTPGILSSLCLSEFVFGKRLIFCTPVLMNMCITFQVLRLSTFVFNKCSKKPRLYLLFRTQRVLVVIMLAQHRRRCPGITSASGQCIVLSGVSGAGMLKRHQHNAAVRIHGTITQCCFNDGPALKTVCQH